MATEEHGCGVAAPSAGRVRVGLISDTHGALRPEAAAFLRGCDLIVHAGDICDASILDRLRAIAPTVAVRGNNDIGAWAGALREVEAAEVAGVRIMAIHDIARLGVDLEAAGVDALIHGHTHKPSVERRGRALVVNPGQRGAAPLLAAHLHRRAGDRRRRRFGSLGGLEAPRRS